MATTIKPGPGDDWFYAGPTSSFPNITATASREPYFKLAWPQPCSAGGPPSSPHAAESPLPGCRVFHPNKTGWSPSTSFPAPRGEDDPSAAAAAAAAAAAIAPSAAEEVDIDAAPGEDAWAMREQVVVFRYEGTFHAVDHACPHRAYSMAWGRPFDIEDAGRVLGRAIRCRGHGYAFELSTGEGDRGDFRLGVWEVEVRSAGGGGSGVVLGEGDGVREEKREEEVWVRRRRKGAR